jgi:hypothetical protein
LDFFGNAHGLRHLKWVVVAPKMSRKNTICPDHRCPSTPAGAAWEVPSMLNESTATTGIQGKPVEKSLATVHFDHSADAVAPASTNFDL